jgi:hypothetical protein
MKKREATLAAKGGDSIDRRTFLKAGGGGMVTLMFADLSLAGHGLFDPFGKRGCGGAVAGTVDLEITEALVEMVDLTPVYHWVFGIEGKVPSLPGPVIFAAVGDTVTFRVTNRLDEPHGFRIVGAGNGGSDLDSTPAVLQPGATGSVTFTPAQAGTFMYLDPRNAPVNRVLGLHGALVVLPRGVREGTPVNTPYSNPTPRIQQLFDDLGTAPHFPGDPWIPVRPAEVPPNPELPAEIEPFLYRTRIWLFSQVDERFNELAALGGSAEPGGGLDPAAFVQAFLPRYFLINGKSGAFASMLSPETELRAFIGEPHVVRVLNAGLAHPSLHQHANHFYPLAVNNTVLESAFLPDTITLAPLEGDPGAALPEDPLSVTGRLFLRGGSSVDWLMPFIRPPDIPGNPNIPLRDLIPTELALSIEGVPQSPLKYPMHDHMEQSQTAAGGNYPQGDLTDMYFIGDLDKVPFPNPSSHGVPPPGGGGGGHGHG